MEKRYLQRATPTLNTSEVQIVHNCTLAQLALTWLIAQPQTNV